MGKKKPKAKPSKPAAAGVESNSVSVPNKTDIEAIAAAICSANQAVFMKVCRLCESKDGPFLNIFDADKVTAKKIDELMPFGVSTYYYITSYSSKHLFNFIVLSMDL